MACAEPGASHDPVVGDPGLRVQRAGGHEEVHRRAVVDRGGCNANWYCASAIEVLSFSSLDGSVVGIVRCRARA